MATASQYTFKVLMIGDSGAGKTSLVARFVDDMFAQTYTATVGIDSKSKVVELGGCKVKLQIWDTAGQERFRTLTSAYYRGAQGIVLTYDITRPDTFKNVSYWLSNVDEYAPPGVKKILIANKVDLYPDREVSTEDGQAKARNHEMQLFEASAKTGEKVEESFMALAQEMKEVAKRQELRRAVAEHGEDSGGVNLENGHQRGRNGGCCGSR